MRAYGDSRRRAALRRHRALTPDRRPDVPWWRVVRADGSLAKGGRQRALLEAEGVPFRGERVDMARRHGFPTDVVQREITLRAAPARLPPRHGRGRRARCPSSRDAARRAAARVHPPHLGVADAQRERLARRAPRLRDLVQRRRARGRRAYWTHTLEGADDMPAHIKASLLGPSLTLPVARRPPRARHLAGDLPVRAPRPRRAAVARRDGVTGRRRPDCLPASRPGRASRRTRSRPRARPRSRRPGRRSRPACSQNSCLGPVARAWRISLVAVSASGPFFDDRRRELERARRARRPARRGG